MNVNLVRLKKGGTQKVFPLLSASILIGRHRSCNLRIPLDSVSKKHCQLTNDGKIWKIRDLGSHNGTYLNGKKVEEAEVQPGNSLTIGPLTFVIQIDGQPDLNSPPQNEQSTKPQPQQAPQSQQLTPMEKTEENLIEDDQFANFSDLQLDDLKSLESLEDSDSA
jgi:pSer/pThr/pTyr-binding forkhead associated (FHA) protein